MTSLNGREHANGSVGGLTLAAYAEAKELPEAFLRNVGVSQIYLDGASVVRMVYRAADGTDLGARFRIALDGRDRFRWKRGTKVIPYGLDRLHLALQAGEIVLVEGESDAHTCWYHDYPALGLPGAGAWREGRDAPCLDGIDVVYVVIEPDSGGEAVLAWLESSSIRDRVRLVDLSPFGVKDVSALYLQGPDAFPFCWRQALDAATPYAGLEDQARQRAAAAAYDLGHDLLHAPELLSQVQDAIRRRGYAGDLNAPTLVYVAIISRLLERPQNLGVIAPSAAGKNTAVDAGRELHPPEAVYIVKAGSSRALIYNDEDFAHRIILFAEADSIPEDGPAASAVRSLASDNEMSYEVVERDEQTGRFTTRKITKPGPTGLITTSTRPLGEQLGTRLLEVPISDDASQTRQVMRAHAGRVMPAQNEPIDLAPFHAAQRWLELAGERRIAVPFAPVLADLLPATAVRMRRDFRQLLTTIQAIALLHQCQRDRTPEGWVEATIADYALARELLAPIFDTIAAEGVTAAVRETVEAVKDGEEISEAELVRRLGLSKAAVSYRVKRAVLGSWLVNHEQRKGHPARLTRGALLPERTTALPAPGQEWEAFERSHHSGDDRRPLPPTTVISEGGTQSDDAIANGLFTSRCQMCGADLVPGNRYVCEGCALVLDVRIGAA